MNIYNLVQLKRSKLTGCVGIIYSHLSLWHSQVQVVEDLQFAIRSAHISTPDRKVFLSSRQRRLQISLHFFLLQLEERTFC